LRIEDELREELSIDPNNAGAEYVLASSAKGRGDFSTAIVIPAVQDRYRIRRSKYFGLAPLWCRQSVRRRIPPLETYERLARTALPPFSVALAYNVWDAKTMPSRGALQRDTAKSLEQVKRRVRRPGAPEAAQ